MKIEPNGKSLTFCIVDEGRPPKFQRHYFSVATEEQREWLKELIMKAELYDDIRP